MRGELVHLEIPAPDTEAARSFYGALFGWQFEDYGGADYHMMRLGEGRGGAISGVDGDSRGPRAYFDVEEIAPGAAQVRELGGEASEPMPVPGMGWFVTCTDPFGNEFGLWQTDPSAPMPTS